MNSARLDRRPVPRARRPPHWVAGCWVISMIFGANAVLATAGSGAGLEPLRPATVVAYLRQAVGPGVAQLRVDGVYGSGHAGQWLVFAHVSWRQHDGTLRGATVTVPPAPGTSALHLDDNPGSVALDNLTAAHLAGWTLDSLAHALRAVKGPADPLAMIELDTGAGKLISCHGNASRAECGWFDGAGHSIRSFGAALLDAPPPFTATSVQIWAQLPA